MDWIIRKKIGFFLFTTVRYVYETEVNIITKTNFSGTSKILTRKSGGMKFAGSARIL